MKDRSRSHLRTVLSLPSAGVTGVRTPFSVVPKDTQFRQQLGNEQLDLATRSSSCFLMAWELQEPSAAQMSSSAKHSFLRDVGWEHLA